ncbi:ribonuclease T2 family protein [Neoaquamicrobium microcysteis]|uniref:ribonuclease T2 family protein n=1 Tax=Neoaquamicrobium microcysteis TaxID=2682781 RepID=UPI001F30B127|nr:ribonuclease [Mesorhizobium microcysteis]
MVTCRVRAALAATALLAGCSPSESQQPLPRGEGFDFYVLSLSWSPSYCEAEGENASRQQCSRDHAFVVHGLWPQFEKGWPEFCDSDEPGRVPEELARAFLDILPSVGLIGHQWRKHGSCTGLSQRDYLEATRAAHERVRIPDRFEKPSSRVAVEPDEVEASFVAANPGMSQEGIAVTCDGQLVREVRICLSVEMAFRSCEEVDARACRLPRAAMPAALP